MRLSTLLDGLRHAKIASETHRSEFSCCLSQPQSPGSHLCPHTGEQLSLAAPLHSYHVVVNGHCLLIPQHGGMVEQKARTPGVASVRLGIGSLQSTYHPQVSHLYTGRTMRGTSNLRLSSVLMQLIPCSQILSARWKRDQAVLKLLHLGRALYC